MQFCVYVSAQQYGCVHVEAESEEDAEREAEKLCSRHQISWHEEEITDMSVEEVYT